MLPLALISCLSLVSSCLAGECYYVKKVIDGDTIELVDGTKIRYIGIDTPETVHPSRPVEFMGKEASDFNKNLVEGKCVRLEYDVQRTDKSGRTLAYVFLDSIFVNAELVKLGYAQTLTVPPDVQYEETFLKLQREAREDQRGLWSETKAQEWSALATVPASKYYVTDSGKKYHKGGCKYLARSAIEISKEEAEAKGFSPCALCFPSYVSLSTGKESHSRTYYITNSGTKYHAAGCRYLAKSAIAISLKDAQARGYGPCSVCIGSSSYSSPSPGKSNYSSTGRCQAITKKGSQCKRNARPGSRYCWQHGG